MAEENKKVSKGVRLAQFRQNVNLFSMIGSLVLGVLLLALLIRYTQNQFNPILPTFTSLLEKFSTSEVATVPFVNFSSLSLGDWGVFDFLQVFIESIISIFNVLLFFINGIISAISYIVWFMQWLFIG